MKNKYSTEHVSRFGYLFCAPYFILYLVFGVFPILFTFAVSFMDWQSINEWSFVGLQNYTNMFSVNYSYLKSIGNTLVIMVFTVPFDTVCGVLLAYVLQNSRIKAKGFFRIVNLLPYIISNVALGLLFALMFDYQIGSVNHILTSIGLTDAPIYWLGLPVSTVFVVCLAVFWKWLGYYMVMYVAGFSNVSNDVLEAARIDGANERQLLWRVSLPLIKPTIVFMTITSIIGALQLQEEPMVLLASSSNNVNAVGGPARVALTAGWNIYDTAFGAKKNFGVASAMSVVLFLLIAVFAFSGFRLLTKKGDD